MRVLDFLKKVTEAKTSAELTAKVYTKGHVYELPVMSVECTNGGKLVSIKIDGFQIQTTTGHKDVLC